VCAEAYFLDLFERVIDPNYLAPKKLTPGTGYELFQSFAAVFARASQAFQNVEIGNLILWAKGGAYATGTVEFYRDSTAHGAVTVKAGTIVKCSRTGREFVTTADCSLGVGPGVPLAMPASVRAVAQSWQWNVPGPVTRPSGEVLPGEIDTIEAFSQDPPFGDPTIRVRQTSDMAGGRFPMLDALALDMGFRRNTGESDESLRNRVRALPDAVTYAAILKLLNRFFGQFAWTRRFTFDLIETWEKRYQTCYDWPSGMSGPVFVYDDPRANPPFRNRWLDSVEQERAFIVVAPRYPALAERGLVYDDPAASVAALATVGVDGGFRSVPAYDMPIGYRPTTTGCYDGWDTAARAIYAGLWQMLQKARAAGYAAILERSGN
jgi:hypothetical protein